MIRRLPPTDASLVRSASITSSVSFVAEQLVHNALDAGACRIAVRVTFSPTISVAVFDNGRGISLPSDWALIGALGATSSPPRSEKGDAAPASAASLGSLADAPPSLLSGPRESFGTHGEFLHALSHVSIVSIVSRGYRAVLKDGRIVWSGSMTTTAATASEEWASTCVTASAIFASLPVRAAATDARRESAELLASLHALAVVSPSTAFGLTSDGSLLLSLQGSPSTLGALSAIVGPRAVTQLSHVTHSSGPYRVRGFVGAPFATSATCQLLYLGGRPARGLVSVTRIIENAARDNIAPSRHVATAVGATGGVRAQLPVSFALNIECARNSADVVFEGSKTFAVFNDAPRLAEMLTAAVRASLGLEPRPLAAGEADDLGAGARRPVVVTEPIVARAPASSLVQPTLRLPPLPVPRKKAPLVPHWGSISRGSSGIVSGETSAHFAPGLRLLVSPLKPARSYTPPRAPFDITFVPPEHIAARFHETFVPRIGVAAGPLGTATSHANYGSKAPGAPETTFVATLAANVAAAWTHVVTQERTDCGERAAVAARATVAAVSAHHQPAADLVSRAQLTGAVLIGQFDKSFLLITVPSAGAAVVAAGPQEDPLVTQLAIVDQHAADERSRLELLEAALFGEPGPHGQRGLFWGGTEQCERVSVSDDGLIIECASSLGGEAAEAAGVAAAAALFKSSLVSPPLAFDVSPRERLIIRANAATLLAWGFDVRLHGDAALLHGTARVLGVTLDVMDLRAFLAHIDDALDDVRVDGGTILSTAALYHKRVRPPAILRILSSKSCRGAIMFGDALTLEECKNLLSRLRRTRLPFNCAHGRPSIVPLLTLLRD